MKITINQIEQMIKENVNNVVSITKVSGTNSWFVHLKTSEDVEPAYNVMKQIGFKLSDDLKRISKNNKNIMAEFIGIDSTYYGRQISQFA